MVTAETITDTAVKVFSILKINIILQQVSDGFHIFCNVKLGKNNCRALIDTGASKSVLSKSFKEKLNLEEFVIPNDNQISGIHPGQTDISFVKIENLSFGKFTICDFITGIIDLEHINEQYKILGIKPFDLIIGGDILAETNAVIDYKNKTLVLTKN